ncbi:MAG: hypothetical protein HQL24_08100 [Candidatus Omnitrophica bacterium]|nr:hypothetical protein [Candidatus Omnitrophota bacterium]
MPFKKRVINFLSSERFFSLCILTAAGWYVALCFLHYFNQRPLWCDENCVLQSIKSFSPMEIFNKKLILYQVFPRLYLLFIQQVSRLFNYHLLALRFLPFVAMMCAFRLWLKIARYEMKNNWEYLTFVFSWSGAGLLIYYAAELKQYSMDVLVASVFILFLYHQERLAITLKPSRYIALLVLLPFLGLFSYPAFIFVALVFYNLVRAWIEKKKDLSFVLCFVGAVFLALALSYFFDMRLRPISDVTAGFNNNFISLNSPGDFLKTFQEGVNNIFSRFFTEKPKFARGLARSFVVFGLVYLFYTFFKNFKKENYYLKSINTIALAAFMGLFVLGILHKYPFGLPRTTLFFAPVVLFLTVKGISSLKGIHPLLYRVIQGGYIIFLLYLTTGLARCIFSGDLGGMPEVWLPL